MLAPTPKARLVDGQNRPYFLWDEEHTTLERFVERLHDPDPDVRAYSIGKMMREAKPDDVFTFVTKAEIEAQWPRIVIHLGRERTFWTWILARWRELQRDAG